MLIATSGARTAHDGTGATGDASGGGKVNAAGPSNGPSAGGAAFAWDTATSVRSSRAEHDA
jgi:hypothetical protein